MLHHQRLKLESRNFSSKFHFTHKLPQHIFHLIILISNIDIRCHVIGILVECHFPKSCRNVARRKRNVSLNILLLRVGSCLLRVGSQACACQLSPLKCKLTEQNWYTWYTVDVLYVHTIKTPVGRTEHVYRHVYGETRTIVTSKIAIFIQFGETST